MSARKCQSDIKIRQGRNKVICLKLMPHKQKIVSVQSAVQGDRNGIGPIIPPPSSNGCIYGCGFDRYGFEKADVETDVCGSMLLIAKTFNLIQDHQQIKRLCVK